MTDATITSFDNQIAALTAEKTKQQDILNYFTSEKPSYINGIISALYANDDTSFRTLYNKMQDRNFQLWGQAPQYITSSNLTENTDAQRQAAVAAWASERDVKTKNDADNVKLLLADLTSKINLLIQQKNDYIANLPKVVQDQIQADINTQNANAQVTAAQAAQAAAAAGNETFAQSKAKTILWVGVITFFLLVAIILFFVFRKTKPAPNPAA